MLLGIRSARHQCILIELLEAPSDVLAVMINCGLVIDETVHFVFNLTNFLGTEHAPCDLRLRKLLHSIALDHIWGEAWVARKDIAHGSKGCLLYDVAGRARSYLLACDQMAGGRPLFLSLEQYIEDTLRSARRSGTLLRALILAHLVAAGVGIAERHGLALTVSHRL